MSIQTTAELVTQATRTEQRKVRELKKLLRAVLASLCNTSEDGEYASEPVEDAMKKATGNDALLAACKKALKRR